MNDMRIKLLLSLILAGFSYAAQAQFSFGVVGFPQISNLTSKSIRQDPVLDNRLTFSGGAGVNVTYNFSESIGLQLGVLYSSQNQKIRSHYTIGGEKYTHDSKKRFDYLKLPLVLRYSQPVGMANLVLFAGPQFSYLLKYDGGMIVYIEDQYYDLPATPPKNDFYKKYTLDATGGIGIEYPITKYIDLVTALKVDCSLTDAENKNAEYNGLIVSQVNGSGSSAARNVTYALLLGLNFKMKDKNDLIAPSNKFRGKSYGKKRR
jgi:hypothetical protein